MIDVEKFIKDGWCIVDIKARIPFINCYNIDISQHEELSEQLWRSEYSLEIAQLMMPFISQLIGLDLMVQYNPYLRIARPGMREDNIGYHKDTQYGQTPYELAVHIPFVDLDGKSAIRVISGSHLLPENAFVGITPDGYNVKKGSIENHMGKPYMPKCLKIPDGMETTPLVMEAGQAAIFSPAIFHGQEVNEGDITRVSCDMRFVSSHAPVELKLGKVHAGYVPVSQSPVEKMATKYYEAQNGN